MQQQAELASAHVNSSPSPTLVALLRKGATDAALQTLATTGVRFALIASIPLLALFLSPEEVGRLDLFVIGANFLLILLSLGVDSGLAIAIPARTALRRSLYLLSALLVIVSLSVLLLIPVMVLGRFVTDNTGLQHADLAWMYGYSICNTMMVAVFSYYRWLGRALVASVLVITGNTIGLGLGYLALYVTGTLSGLMAGLTLGSLSGALLCIWLALNDAALKHPFQARRLLAGCTARLIRLSWPFAVASILLLSRRFVDRGILLSLGTLAMLGSYATVSRTGELMAFAIAIPAVGLSPLIVKHAHDAMGKRLARLLLGGYVAASIATTAIGWFLWHRYGPAMFPDEANEIAAVFLAAIVGSLLFGQTTVAGYGFIVQRNTTLIAGLSVFFLIVYAVIALPFVMADKAVSAVGVGFVGASFLYGALFVFLSERKLKMGYPQPAILAINSVLALVAITPLF